MSKIYIDTSKLKKCYYGTRNVKKIYKDEILVWQSAIPVEKPINLSPSGTYNGSIITNGYDTPDGVIMEGTNSSINAGTYTATYTPDEDHIWADTEDRTPVSVTLTIERASVGAKPTTSVSKTYSGSSQNNGYTTPSGVGMTGSNSGTNAGTYTATYTPDSNHIWGDDTTSSITVTLTIATKSISGATVTLNSTSKTFNNASQSVSVSSVTLSGFTPTYTVGGTTSATNVGTYTVTVTGNGNFSGSASATWKINKLSLTKPSLTNNSKTYNGSPQSPTINNYNSTYETQSGTTSSTNAGSWTVTWSLKSTTNTQWSDGTTGNVTGTWSIAAKAVSTWSLTSSAIVNSESSTTITFKCDSGVPWKCSSNNSNCTVSPATGTGTGANQTITITGKTLGSSTVTVATNSSNYASKSATCSIVIKNTSSININWNVYVGSSYDKGTVSCTTTGVKLSGSTWGEAVGQTSSIASGWSNWYTYQPSETAEYSNQDRVKITKLTVGKDSSNNIILSISLTKEIYSNRTGSTSTVTYDLSGKFFGSYGKTTSSALIPETLTFQYISAI